MNANDAVGSLRTLLTEIMNWALGFCAVISSVMVLASFAAMLGHPVPYVPPIKADMYQFAVFIAACKYAFWK